MIAMQSKRLTTCKCDEKLPTCERCSKSGRTCQYPDYQDFHFKDQTDLASQRAIARWRSRAKGQASGTDPFFEDDHSGVDATRYKLHQASLTPPKPLIYNPKPPLEAIAVKRFFSDYVSCPNDFVPWMNFLRTLPSLYAAASPNSYLSAAVLAISYANLTERPSCRQMRSQAIGQYTRALQLLNEALRKPEEVAKDAMILTVTLFALYEAMMSEPGSQYKPVDKHFRGALALSKTRGQNLLETEDGRTLFFQVYFQGVGLPLVHAQIWTDSVYNSSSRV